MSAVSPNLRKAAVLIRSLDAETAAGLLAQLSADEAAALRTAVQSLGPIDADERADVVAEFCRAAPIAAKPATEGVELKFTRQSDTELTSTTAVTSPAATKRFEFLDNAAVDALAPYLAREHVQTIALVLAHLPPARAAMVLAALPQKLQADAIERLALLGETDPESVVVVERELAAWMAKRSLGRLQGAPGRGSVASILAAADASTRDAILGNLKTHKEALARRLAIHEADRTSAQSRRSRNVAPRQSRGVQNEPHDDRRQGRHTRQIGRVLNPPPAAPALSFDELIHFNDQMLVGLLREIDPNVLALALAGSRDELVDRICGQMSKRTAREFRRRLRQLGPTRLSDVEAAQHAVARIAVQHLSPQRTRRLSQAA
jgi:flagellar motor switch protein FliG